MFSGVIASASPLSYSATYLESGLRSGGEEPGQSWGGGERNEPVTLLPFPLLEEGRLLLTPAYDCRLLFDADRLIGRVRSPSISASSLTSDNLVERACERVVPGSVGSGGSWTRIFEGVTGGSREVIDVWLALCVRFISGRLGNGGWLSGGVYHERCLRRRTVEEPVAEAGDMASRSEADST